MKKAVEFRYALLTNLILLLWLAVEGLLGFQDKYISWHPVLTLCSSLVPLFCYNEAFKEKQKYFGTPLSLRNFLSIGFLLSLFSGLLAIPAQWLFIKFINPDFLDELIHYTVANSGQPIEVVVKYINVQSHIIESSLFTFLTGILVTLVLALRAKFTKL